MLVWHDAERTEDGIRRAAQRIADTIYGHDARPSVGEPPAYINAVRIPGLTAADSALLTLLAEEAISTSMLRVYVNWSEVLDHASGKGLDETAVTESLAALEQHRYVRRLGLRSGGSWHLALSSAAVERASR